MYTVSERRTTRRRRLRRRHHHCLARSLSATLCFIEPAALSVNIQTDFFVLLAHHPSISISLSALDIPTDSVLTQPGHGLHPRLLCVAHPAPQRQHRRRTRPPRRRLNVAAGRYLVSLYHRRSSSRHHVARTLVSGKAAAETDHRLRLFLSPYFSISVAMHYLKTYPDNIGISHYLCWRIKAMPYQEVEFYWPQIW